MEEALVTRLLATVAITDIFHQHIHWQTRPPNSNSLPALTLSIAADIREYNHDGPDDMQEVRVQFDSRALTYLEAKQGLRAVLSEMETEETVGGYLFHEGRKVSGSDAPKETLGGGTEVFIITMDVMVQFRPEA
jgi:hypothetical protein